MVIEYFCDECGAIFTAKKAKFIRCPKCGCYCCYENTDEGRLQSIKDLTSYENEVDIGDDD